MTGWLVLRYAGGYVMRLAMGSPLAWHARSDDTGKSIAERNADINKRRLARSANAGGQLKVRRRA